MKFIKDLRRYHKGILFSHNHLKKILINTNSEINYVLLFRRIEIIYLIQFWNNYQDLNTFKLK
jgi:hypothetical protein